MRLRLFVAAALAPAALAQDGGSVPPAGPAAPPAEKKPEAPAPKAPEKPAKHENKVSDTAKAAWEAMEKMTYNPVALGLKDLQGRLVLKVEVPGMDESTGAPPMSVEFAISFTAPDKVTVDASTDNEMLAMQLDSMKREVKQLVSLSMGDARSGRDEYDADLEEKDGTKTLVLKYYEKNVPSGESRLTLDDRGLPTKGVVKAVDPNMGMEVSVDISFQYATDGDRFRLEKMNVQNPMMPGPMEMTFSYADVGGFKVLTAIDGKMEVMGMSTRFRYTELTVNGKKVELPAAKAPEKEEEKKAAPTDPAPPLPPTPPSDDK